MIWNELSITEKKIFKDYCDNKFGSTPVKCETGEPIYFDENYNIIDTKPIIEILFINKN